MMTMKKLTSLVLVVAFSAALCGGALAFTYEKDYFKDDYADALKQIQQKLIELDYLSGKADGWFGNKTQSAIKQFQLVHGLEPTGVADRAFQEMLFSDQAQPSPGVLMSLEELKKLMSESGKLGVKYDLSDMEVERNSGTVELNNHVVMYCELLGDDVTQVQLIGRDNVKIPFTMLLMAFDSSIDIANMYTALDMLIEEGERHKDGRTIRYSVDEDGTQRLTVTPMESGTLEE